MSSTVLTRIFVLLSLTLFAFSATLKRGNIPTIVNLRIEGSTTTIYEAPILTFGHNVTTKSGGTHECDGLNNGENPKAGPTCTSALDDASHLAHFPFDGTFDPEFDDFFITSIGPDTETDTEFWGILLNFQFTPVGGCQQEVKLGDDVLWAFNAFNVDAFLKLSGPALVKKGSTATFKVIDGSTGNPIEGATVGGQTTDANGNVQISFPSIGVQKLKASKTGTIRSNAIIVVVA